MQRKTFNKSNIRLLFENRPALYFCNYTENEITILVCWIYTLFIYDFMGIMEK